MLFPTAKDRARIAGYAIDFVTMVQTYDKAEAGKTAPLVEDLSEDEREAWDRLVQAIGLVHKGKSNQ